MKYSHVMMLLSCPLWCHDISFPPAVDMVQHLVLTFPPLSVPIYTNEPAAFPPHPQHLPVVRRFRFSFPSTKTPIVCLLSFPMNSKSRFASLFLVMAHNKYFRHLLCAPMTLFLCTLHPTLSFFRPFLLSLLQSSAA